MTFPKHATGPGSSGFSQCVSPLARAALAPTGAFLSHRSTVPSRLRISGGFLPVPTVETVPTASPSLAVGTTISQTPRASGEEPLRARGKLGGASASLFYSGR